MVSGQRDLAHLFADVIDESFSLFHVDQAGLWTYRDAEQPLTIAAHRGLSSEILALVATLTRDATTAGMTAIREQRVQVMDGDLSSTLPELRDIYQRAGIRTICFVPVVFAGEPLGLLVLYHHSRSLDPERDRAGPRVRRRWPSDRQRAPDRVDPDPRRTAALDLRPGHPAQPDPRRRGHGQAIVSEARGLIDDDTVRVYQVDHEAGTCEPIAFQGTFAGLDRPGAKPPGPDRPGPDGLGRRAPADRPAGDAADDPRGLIVGSTDGPESMLLVPMIYEEVVQGVLVVSKAGADRFGPDDETTLAIFAGYAAQALVNAANLGRLQRQQSELEHQLASQRRLIEVNERLLSTLDPGGVLDLIADTLQLGREVRLIEALRVDRVGCPPGGHRP